MPEKPKYLTIAELKAYVEAAPDDALVLIDDGTTLCRPIISITAFRARKVAHRDGEAFRLGASGDVPVAVLATV